MKHLLAAAVLALSAPVALADDWRPLLEPDALATVIAEEEPVILDIRSPGAYAEGHLEGAINVPYHAWRGPETNPGALIPDEKLTFLLSESGVEPDVPVVITYQGTGTLDFGSAARVYWTLKAAGVEQAAILNGGIQAWAAAGHELTADEGANFPSDLEFSFAPHMVADAQAVSAVLAGKARATLLDARPTPFFTGAERHEAATTGGTFDGAASLPHEIWFDGPRLSVTADQVQARLADAGVDTGAPMISFCNTGHWAATNWFVLSEIAGIEGVTLYPESWVGWTRERDRLAARQ